MSNMLSSEGQGPRITKIARREEPAIAAERGPAEGASPPILNFCLGPEIRAAVEAYARLHVFELQRRATGLAIEEGVTKPEEADQDWNIESSTPNKAVVTNIISYCVLKGLETLQRDLQRMQLEDVKINEGFKQISEFLFDHPEIERAAAEYFTREDPAYQILRRGAGETEYDVPYDRPIAIHGLAAAEALLRADAITSAAIERALASRKRATDPEAE